jgi:phenylpropionate dioxygenase-like ring-hydroxylating dioxygenase large terminal subunit
MHYKANYLLVADNLLDFSHLAFVHEKTLGGSAKYARQRPLVTRTPRRVRVDRWLLDDAAAPFLRTLKSWPGNVDRWNNYDFVLPGILLMDSGSAPTGTGAQEGNRVDAAEFFGCQAITPETETTSHYFFQQSHHFALDTLFSHFALGFQRFFNQAAKVGETRVHSHTKHFFMSLSS